MWGSYWRDGNWGYACCHALEKASYCAGEQGRIARAENTEKLLAVADDDEEEQEQQKTLVEQHLENQAKKEKKKKVGEILLAHSYVSFRPLIARLVEKVQEEEVQEVQETQAR